MIKIIDNNIGVYKITNKINNKSYVGESLNIKKRWGDHIIASNNKNSFAYNYPLYQDMRKYGIENFKFDIIENIDKKDVDILKDIENKYIKNFKCEYNQTCGYYNKGTSTKLTEKEVIEIRNILLHEDNISYKDIALKFNVHIDTIRSINFGREWNNPNYNYPLYIYKINKKMENKCCNCGKVIDRKSKLCLECYNKERAKNIPSKIELIGLLKLKTVYEVAIQYKVTDTSVRKWCKKYDLPYTFRKIKSTSQEEWDEILRNIQ